MDINFASVEELVELPGVSPSLAYDIMLWRPFLSWNEVEAVPLFIDVDFEQLRGAGLTLRLPDRSAWRV